jgi:hypothetical protein
MKSKISPIGNQIKSQKISQNFELVARAQSRPFRDELAELSDKGDAKQSHYFGELLDYSLA